MARYRKIAPAIWNDAKFRGLSDNAKLVFFMLLTHPQTTPIGTLRAYQQGLAPEMGWSEKAFREAFREVVEKGMAICSERDGLIWLPNFMKHNTPENPNVLKSWAASLETCPECSLKIKVYEQIKAFAEGLGKAFREAFAEAFRVPLPNQEQEQEQEQDIKNTPNGVFVAAEGDDDHETVDENKDDGLPPCPHGEIVALYHEILPELPRVKVWEGSRKTHLQARWREALARQHIRDKSGGLDYWRRYFGYVRKCPLLMGQVSQRDGRSWRADLPWLVKPENYAKVIEGRYMPEAGNE